VASEDAIVAGAVAPAEAIDTFKLRRRSTPMPSAPQVGTMPIVSVAKFNELQGQARKNEINRVAQQFKDAHKTTSAVALCAVVSFFLTFQSTSASSAFPPHRQRSRVKPFYLLTCPSPVHGLALVFFVPTV
jgi:hypothetical protein